MVKIYLMSPAQTIQKTTLYGPPRADVSTQTKTVPTSQTNPISSQQINQTAPPKKSQGQPSQDGQSFIKADYRKSYQEQKSGWLTKDKGEGGAASKLTYLEKQELRDLMMSISQVLISTQIYKVTHPIVQEKITKIASDMIETAKKFGRLVLSNREDIVWLNGYQEKVEKGPLERLINTFRYFKVSSFEFEKGVTPQEITSFFTTMATQKRQRVTDDINELLKKARITHIRPVFLQYIEVGEVPKDVPRPKNVVVKEGQKIAKNTAEEQAISDFLKGKVNQLPKKLDTFLLNHPKLAAMVIVKMIDEYESQNLDSFSAFQAYVQSMSHYMARLSRVMKNPDKAASTLGKLERHLIVRLKSLKKDRKYINEAKKQIKDALSWVEIEQMVSHYGSAKDILLEKEEKIIEAIEKRRVPSVKELKERLDQVGFFQSKLATYLKKA